MIADYRAWRKAIKLDPARPIGEERLAEVCSWDIDAVIAGGSAGYGVEDVAALLARLRRHRLPLAQEVSDLATVCPGFDLYLIPMVLNSSEIDWVIGHHQAAIKRFGDLVEWDRLAVEGYCILNSQSAAARLSRARTDQAVEDVVAYAKLAEHLLGLPIFYLEYSGTYGPPALVASIRRVLRTTRLWYGGGIKTAEQVEEMERLVDTLVIGNAIYEGYSPLAPSSR